MGLGIHYAAKLFYKIGSCGQFHKTFLAYFMLLTQNSRQYANSCINNTEKSFMKLATDIDDRPCQLSTFF